MGNSNKNVPTKTDKKETNEETKEKGTELGSNIEAVDATIISENTIEKEAISIESEVAEQTLYDEPKSVALLAQEEAILNSVEVITLEKMRYFAREVVKSGVSPFKREADVIVVLIRGAELGLPYGVSVNNIFAINGKTGMSVHLHKALLQNAGVYFELTEDYVPVYNYGLTKEMPNAKGEMVKQFVPVGQTTKTKVEGFQVSPAIVDRQTTYYFEREVKMPLSGKIRTKTLTISFKYSEAVQAQLVDKDVWVKYTRSLMKARAFTLGSSEIASDVTQGMYGINELAMEHNRKFTIDENLQETMIIDVEHTEQ